MRLSLFTITLYSATSFAQQNKVEIKNSPKSNVIIGSHNTIKNITVNAPLAIVSNLESQSVELGKNCVFEVKASGGVKPYKYKWFINEKEISNANNNKLIIKSLDLNYHKAKITAVVTDLKQTIVKSEKAVIKITQPYFVGYSKIDPYVNDTTIPRMENVTMNILHHDSSIIFRLPVEAEGAFWVVKVPYNESLKASWYHNDMNYGDIPDSETRKPFSISNYTYYVSRDSFVFNPRQPVALQTK